MKALRKRDMQQLTMRDLFKTLRYTPDKYKKTLKAKNMKCLRTLVF